MSLPIQLIIRLLVAVLLGALIGYERELRAKNAGVRTHIMVALGAALFMIISQNGFAGAARFDAARVAAGVVTGIGFIGGGIIMKKKHVSGLTTAASLWVTGAVGLGVGCGMYEVAVLCTILVLVCLEILSISSVRLGGKEVTTVLSGPDAETLMEVVETLGKQVREVSFARKENGFQAEVSLYVSKRESIPALFKRLSALPGIQVESLE